MKIELPCFPYKYLFAFCVVPTVKKVNTVIDTPFLYFYILHCMPFRRSISTANQLAIMGAVMVNSPRISVAVNTPAQIWPVLRFRNVLMPTLEPIMNGKPRV